MTDAPKPDDLADTKKALAALAADCAARSQNFNIYGHALAALERLTKERDAHWSTAALAEWTSRAIAAESREREAVAAVCGAAEIDNFQQAVGSIVTTRCALAHAERARDEAVVRAQDSLWGLDHALAATMKERDEAVAERDRLRAALPKLREVAHAAWHALDDGEDRGDGGHIIDDATDLNAALKALCGEEDDIHYALEPIDAMIAALPLPVAPVSEG